ncbi:MAG: helix-turn-helix domain-containing protein [Chloroflexales bacterium]|nr:helix-turn-helix domain-containing protein [Chloroflexales bacterium]
MLTTRQAAQRLGVTQRQVRRFVEAGQLTAQQIGDYPNAPWVITEESLERLVAARATDPPRKGRRPTASERSTA